MSSMSPAKHLSVVAMLFLSLSMAVATFQSSVGRTMSKEDIILKTEKLTHFHFFFHVIISGPNIDDVNAALPPPTSTTPAANAFFGRVDSLDTPLTIGPNISSDRIGSMQGVVVGASPVEELAYFMEVIFVFTEGKYNGSTLVMVGRNQATMKLRELPIVGGTGIFRFARGYALTRTYSPFDNKTGTAIYEYDLYALHY
ncbi:hypothetical protein MLD38_019549 [Melastoma candidum]|uniref:Uncharacterized protein n=1 Tax=Melastoma candidum TaxID=119954 RepID=A0ACB9QXJ5_9MYRT|nr:hypothetical protein MLD38_019549 [Melastoma candidum]